MFAGLAVALVGNDYDNANDEVGKNLICHHTSQSTGAL